MSLTLGLSNFWRLELSGTFAYDQNFLAYNWRDNQYSDPFKAETMFNSFLFKVYTNVVAILAKTAKIFDHAVQRWFLEGAGPQKYFDYLNANSWTVRTFRNDSMQPLQCQLAGSCCIQVVTKILCTSKWAHCRDPVWCHVIKSTIILPK